MGALNHMSILDIFKKNKKDDKESDKEEQTAEETVEITEFEEEPQEDNEILAEYSETINTTSKTEKQTSANEHLWRNVDAIEENIDNIHLKKARKPSNQIEKRVDTIIEKTKK